MVTIQSAPPGTAPRVRRSAAICTVRLLSSIAKPDQAASISVSLETGAPARSTRTRSSTTARLPTGSGSEPRKRISAFASRRNGPKAYTAMTHLTPNWELFRTYLEPLCDFRLVDRQGGSVAAKLRHRLTGGPMEENYAEGTDPVCTA